jgi:hypothetical protein
MSSQSSHFLTAILLISACSACSEPASTAVCKSLQEVRRLGHAELVAAGLSDRAVNAGGGVLGRISGAVPGRDGLTYVLDRYSQKVVVFDSSNNVAGVFFGGEGSGPGEFRLPIHLTRTASGVSVLDYELRRVTEFSPDGQMLRLTTIDAPSPYRHLVHGDTVWVTHHTESPGEPAFYRLTLGAGGVEHGPPLSLEDQRFGTAFGAAMGPSGALYVTTRRPGVWMVLENGQWLRRGSPLYPDVMPPVLEQVDARNVRVTPSQRVAFEIGVIGDSLIVQATSSLARPFDWDDPPSRDETSYALEVFSANGVHLASLELPPEVVPSQMYVGRESGRIFLQRSDPFPQIVEYRLASCESNQISF